MTHRKQKANNSTFKLSKWILSFDWLVQTSYSGDRGAILAHVTCLSYSKTCPTGLKKINKRTIITTTRNYENIRVIYKVIDILTVPFSRGRSSSGSSEVVRVLSLPMKSRGLGWKYERKIGTSMLNCSFFLDFICNLLWVVKFPSTPSRKINFLSVRENHAKELT